MITNDRKVKSSRGSKACSNCRRRRIQCNERRPRCAQCLRASLPCGGYRTDLDLMFVDSTQTTLRRVGKTHSQVDKEWGRVVTQALTPFSYGRESFEAEATSTGMFLRFRDFTPPSQVSATLESAARVFYLEYYAVEGPASSESIQTVSDPLNIRYDSVVAVGTAGLARLERDGALMSLARSRISACLHHMVQIVHDNRGVDKQLIIATVNKMAMFEMVTCDTDSGKESWMTHTRGAVVLMQQWGSHELVSVRNVTGTLYVIYSEAIACLIQKRPIPPGILALITDVSTFKFHSKLIPAKDLFAIIYDLAEINSSACSPKVENVAERVYRLRSIEARLSAWEASLPDDWLYHITRRSISHIYTSLWHAGVWNMYRICCIMLHTLLIRCLKGVAMPVSLAEPMLIASWNVKLQQSKAGLLTKLEEFRASIPYQLGTLPFDDRGESAKKANTTGAFNVLCSIQTLGNFRDVLTGYADWLPETLDYIGTTLGIGQAGILKNQWSDP